MGVGRGRRRQVVLSLHAGDDIPSAVAQVRCRGRPALREQRMWVRVHDDGRVRVMMGGGSTFPATPTLRGVLRADPDRGMVLDAVVRESWLEVLRSALCLVGSVVLAVPALIYVMLGAFGAPYLYISVIAAVLLGNMGRTMQEQRAGSFEAGADELMRRVESVVVAHE